MWCGKAEGLDEFATLSENFRFPIDEGLVGRAWASRQLVWVHDVLVDMEFRRRSLAEQARLKTALFIPVLSGDEPIAVMALFTRRAPDEE